MKLWFKWLCFYFRLLLNPMPILLSAYFLLTIDFRRSSIQCVVYNSVFALLALMLFHLWINLIKVYQKVIHTSCIEFQAFKCHLIAFCGQYIEIYVIKKCCPSAISVTLLLRVIWDSWERAALGITDRKTIVMYPYMAYLST